jgi:hypothetical protein
VFLDIGKVRKSLPPSHEQLAEAEGLYRALIRLNPENRHYFEGLEKSLGLNESYVAINLRNCCNCSLCVVFVNPQLSTGGSPCVV